MKRENRIVDRNSLVCSCVGRIRTIGVYMIAIAMLLTGCQGKQGVEEEDHHIPEHLPADFDQALTRIEQLAAHLGTGAALEKMPTEVNVSTELRDVVRWLPELAAQSDLAEEDWNQVDRATVDLIEKFAKSQEPPERWIGEGEVFSAIADLPKKLAEVRQKYRDMQVPDVVIEAEAGDRP